MKKIIFALIFALFVFASVACVSAVENTNMNTYNNGESNLIQLKEQIDNLETITGQNYLLDDIIEIHFMNNTAEYSDAIILPNHTGEIQDVELNNHPQTNQQDNSNDVKNINNIRFMNNTAEPGDAIIPLLIKTKNDIRFMNNTAEPGDAIISLLIKTKP